jgi:predicted DNA-binding ribbon-helix-helix protein
MKLVSKSIRVNPALWNHVRGIALQRGLTMQTLVDRMLTCYSVRSDWQERVDQAVTTNLNKRDQER